MKNGTGYSKEDDLRSVIREAEGLRPLTKTRLSTDLNTSKFTKRNISNRSRLISSSESISSSELSSYQQLNEKNRTKTRSRRSSNRFMRRRKISSSSRETSSSSRSSIKTTQSKITRREVLINNTSDEPGMSHFYEIDPNEFEACVNLDDRLDISNLIEGHGEDVFITDVTSGNMTVTIKECLSAEGFFKKRETLT